MKANRLKKVLGNPTPEETKQEIVEAVTDQPLALKTIIFRHPKWWGRLLQLIRVLSRTKVLYLNAACAATMIRVTGLLSGLKEIPGGKGNKERLMTEIYRIMSSELPKLIEALAVAIHNKRGVPPEWLFEALRFQFTQSELAVATYEVHRRLGIENFFVIMAFAKNLAATDMLETAVPGQQSEESSSITD